MASSYSLIFENLRSEVNNVIENFRLGELGTGFRHLIIIVEILQEIVNLFGQMLSEMEYSVEEIPLERITNLSSALQELNALLRELMEAMERKDTILIADLLEYELVVKVDEWKLLLCEA